MNKEHLGRFQRDVATMLVAFVAVAVVDLVGVAIVTDTIRFWWPLWLDPNWATDPNSKIVYSQSYFAGIFLAPYLLYLLQRDFLSHWSTGLKSAWWGGGAVVLALLVWWKGSLTLEFHKGRELLTWGLLTVVFFGLAKLAQVIPTLRPGMFLNFILTAAAAVFTFMTLADPVIQLGVHKLHWSWGLTIELIAYGSCAVLSILTLRHLKANLA
jgi:MFS family permease